MKKETKEKTIRMRKGITSKEQGMRKKKLLYSNQNEPMR